MGDRDVAAQPRLRGQQVVEAGVAAGARRRCIRSENRFRSGSNRKVKSIAAISSPCRARSSSSSRRCRARRLPSRRARTAASQSRSPLPGSGTASLPSVSAPLAGLTIAPGRSAGESAACAGSQRRGPLRPSAQRRGGVRPARATGPARRRSSRCSSHSSQSLGPALRLLLPRRQRGGDPARLAARLPPAGKRRAQVRRAPAAKSASSWARAAISGRQLLRTPSVSRRPAKTCGERIFSSGSSLRPELSVSRCPARLPLSTLET